MPRRSKPERSYEAIGTDVSGSGGDEFDTTDGGSSEETASADRGDSVAKRGRTRSTTRAERYQHTRTSAAWAGVVVAVLFGVALIDFIAQNTRDVRIHFFFISGRVPIAVALLAAALAGAVVVVAVGVGRVVQLRLNLRRQRRASKAQDDAAVERETNG
ncbi:MAG TPA: lipopolysaccharide assembly protein LapA domain-containing protein [Acidimicrobiales bacterium]|nr:lipopolysaccharide assembly protein LapA domain-containing protein [Acidimicrobiales bacterium]